jgi:hypothetical protein
MRSPDQERNNQHDDGGFEGASALLTGFLDFLSVSETISTFPICSKSRHCGRPVRRHRFGPVLTTEVIVLFGMS